MTWVQTCTPLTQPLQHRSGGEGRFRGATVEHEEAGVASWASAGFMASVPSYRMMFATCANFTSGSAPMPSRTTATAATPSASDMAGEEIPSSAPSTGLMYM